MKIYEAAEIILRDAGQPMHVKDIYRRIVAQDLFDFKAKDPMSVLSRTLRKNAISSDHPHGGGVFTQISPGTYGLAEWKR